jgi:hypothetical protein
MTHHPPPLHAALDYCARKLLAELETEAGIASIPTPGSNVASSLAAHLTPTSRALLRWWFSAAACSARIDNFNLGQRQAIVHTVLAHELFRTDDPDLLHRFACAPMRAWAEAPAAAREPQYAAYVLKMAPGSGLRWVAQALLLWQWANGVDARTAGCADPRFSGAIVLIAASDAIRRRLQDALLGRVASGGRRDIALSSMARHARLFLPPGLRASLLDWLVGQAHPENGNDVLRIVDAPDGVHGFTAPITLAAGVGARIVAGCGERGVDPTPTYAALLWIDLALSHGSAAATTGSTPIVEFPFERAIAHGATKLPMLEATQQLRAPPLRDKRSRRIGLRPRLSLSHRGLVRIGLQALSRRTTGFIALDPARQPTLLVLCETPQLIRGVRRTLIESGLAEYGLDAAEIAARTVIDTLPARATLTDARICVIVVLRTSAARRSAATVLAPAMSSLWPEPDFSALRAENCERAAIGRMPDNLLDVLSIVEHPECHREYEQLLRNGLAIRGSERNEIDAIGDLMVASLRANADAFGVAMPCACGSERQSEVEDVASVSRRILRARQSMPVRKSMYTHAGWNAHDSGLRRAFLECAEQDAEIESHCLLDPRRHGIRSNDAWLAKNVPLLGLPEALVRTAQAIYLVEFMSFCPAQPLSEGPAERALAQWCSRANALGQAQGQHRCWYRVQLQAPLFWSWKRGNAPLSALLSALADTAPFAQRLRPAAHTG